MSVFSLLGICFLVMGLGLFGYQGLSAFLDLGTSDEFVYGNIKLIDILGDGMFTWIDGISSPSIQSFAETLVNAPAAVWLLGAALFCFLIHAFRGTKHIR
ncbi:MAG: hypothetical protein P8X68_19140 [Desulfobacterales bacterium]|jgi:hypothetical protein